MIDWGSFTQLFLLLPILCSRFKPYTCDVLTIHSGSRVLDDNPTFFGVIHLLHHNSYIWGIRIIPVLNQLKYSDAWITNQLIPKQKQQSGFRSETGSVGLCIFHQAILFTSR